MTETKTMTETEAFEAGKERGARLAALVEIPALGGDHNVWDTFTDEVYEIEMGDRDFSPFECIAHELNQVQDDVLWDQFDNGITQGMKDNWNERVRQPYQRD